MLLGGKSLGFGVRQTRFEPLPCHVFAVTGKLTSDFHAHHVENGDKNGLNVRIELAEGLAQSKLPIIVAAIVVILIFDRF